MTPAPSTGHARWVRVSHWIVTLGVAALAFTGVEILMVHPRLYWGEVGNDLTTPLIELPISRNYEHGGWSTPTPFFAGASSQVTASRTYDIFNQNSWGRSLHFLAGWFLVASGALYLLIGAVAGHFRRHLVPRPGQWSRTDFWREVRNHLRLQIPAATGGPDYGLLQRTAYAAMVFVTLPLMVLTGITMSPAITAAAPWLLAVLGGYQSARTVHFVAFAASMSFLVAHVLMVVKSGFRRQMRGMTIGKTT